MRTLIHPLRRSCVAALATALLVASGPSSVSAQGSATPEQPSAKPPVQPTATPPATPAAPPPPAAPQDPAPAPPADAEPDPGPPGAAPTDADPSPSTQPPPQDIVDDPAVDILYKQALEAFSQGRFVEAESLFRGVAEQTRSPLRRALAEEMARQSMARAEPSQGSATPTPSKRDVESSRTRLLGSTLILGMNYGWMVPLALDVGSEKGFIGLYLITAGASFAVPYLATSDSLVTSSMATLSGGGGFLGLGHGALLSLFAGGDEDLGRGTVGLMVLTSVVESVGGYFWAKNTGMEAGVADAALGGGVAGIGLALLTDLVAWGDELNYIDPRAMGGTLLLGSALGVAGGYYAGTRRDYSSGDVYILETTGLLGTYMGAGSLVLFEVDEPRIVGTVLLASAVGGLMIGDRLVEGLDASKGQGAIIGLGTVAGGLVGGGLGFLMSPNDGSGDDAGKVVLTASIVGAGLGLGLLYSYMDLDRAAAPDDGAEVLGLAPWVGQDRARGLGVVGRF